MGTCFGNIEKNVQDDVGFKMTSNYKKTPQKVGIWSPHVFVQNLNGVTPILMLGGLGSLP